MVKKVESLNPHLDINDASLSLELYDEDENTLGTTSSDGPPSKINIDITDLSTPNQHRSGIHETNLISTSRLKRPSHIAIEN